MQRISTMHARRRLRSLPGRLVAVFLTLGTLLGSAPARAENLCGAALAQHEPLRNALDRGGWWTATQGSAAALRFAEIEGCAYVMAPGWDWFPVEVFADFDGAYQGTAKRRRTDGVEVVILRFRFGTSAGVSYIDYDLYTEPRPDQPFVSANRQTGTLFLRP